MERRRQLVLLLLLMALLPLPAAASPARILSGLLSNAFSSVLRKLWSLTASTRNVETGRPMMKFESGYNVETVFDGSKLGIEPHSVEVLPDGDFLVLDSINSNIYRIAPPLSRYSRPKLFAGSAEAYTGHVDGRPRESKMNHPMSFTVDDRGNIYVADTMNMAIRKISDTGVTTIAGGKWNKGGHIDGPSKGAKFSDNFEIVYVGSSCSLLVVDRGNEAIREIHLRFDDCTYQYGTGIPLGIVVLLAAGFFGYMIALLQHRVGMIVSSQNEPMIAGSKAGIVRNPYQKAAGASQLIPNEDGSNRHEEEGFIASIWGLLGGAFSSISEILEFFSNLRRRPRNCQLHRQQQNTCSVQESFVIGEEDQPPPVEERTPTPHKTYAFMAKDPQKLQHLRHSQAYFNEWSLEPKKQQHMKHHRHHSLGPHTYFEHSSESTEEIVFGAVQGSGSSRSPVEIKAVDYGDPLYNRFGSYPRFWCNG